MTTTKILKSILSDDNYGVEEATEDCRLLSTGQLKTMIRRLENEYTKEEDSTIHHVLGNLYSWIS